MSELSENYIMIIESNAKIGSGLAPLKKVSIGNHQNFPKGLLPARQAPRVNDHKVLEWPREL